MRLSDLLAISDLDPAIGAIEIAGLSADSRAIRAGEVFFAIPGHAGDGLSFVADAKGRGACAVVAQRHADCGLPLIVVDDVRAALAHAAARFYPRQPQTIVAVTGTSGKTSVVAFLRQIWRACSHAAASLGTVGVVDPFLGAELGLGLGFGLGLGLGAVGVVDPLLDAGPTRAQWAPQKGIRE